MSRLKYPAGRKLDALVATEFMGYKAKDIGDPGKPLVVWEPCIDNVDWWSPSTRMDHALRVYSEAERRGWWIECDDNRRRRNRTTKTPGIWYEVNRRLPDPVKPARLVWWHYWQLDSGAPTYETAICHAALKIARWLKSNPQDREKTPSKDARR